MREATRVGLALIACMSLALPLAALPPGAPEEEEWVVSPGTGRIAFRRYCGSCHGSAGEGDGNVAEFLDPAPADLTGISERYDGWPEERLYKTIDGREPVKGHGTRDMPVWGEVLGSPVGASLKTPEEQAELADRTIKNLVAYLATIQREPVD